MDWDVIEVKLVGEFEIFVRFKDGVKGNVKFLPSFFRGVFEHLRDQSNFRQVIICYIQNLKITSDLALWVIAEFSIFTVFFPDHIPAECVVKC